MPDWLRPRKFWALARSRDGEWTMDGKRLPFACARTDRSGKMRIWRVGPLAMIRIEVFLSRSKVDE